MTFGFYWIPAKHSEDAEASLNKAISSKRIVSIEKYFCAASEPGWAICIEYTENDNPASVERRKSKSIDYKEVLDEPTFRIFSALRQVRKKLSEDEGIPAYAIITNEQLAEIAEKQCVDITDLKTINGFGTSRIQKYGRKFLECIQINIKENFKNTEDETNRISN